MDKRIKFYSQNTNLLPPTPKSSFRHLKQGIQEFHRKYVLVPADKAANNVVVICWLHYINNDNVYERSGENMFRPIKNSGEVLSKLKDIGYQATSLSTYDFSTLYTSLPHNLIKEKLLDLIERTFYKTEGELYLACNDKKAFFTSKDHYKGYQLWSCQNVCDALSFLLENIYIRFGTKLYNQIVGIPMGTNCAPLVTDLLAHLSLQAHKVSL